MGISRLDAWAIQCNEVSVEAYKHKTEEKYGMAIYLMKNGEIDRLSVSSSNLPYSSAEEAKKEGILLVNEIRAMDLGAPGKVLEQIAGKETAEIVKKIVDTSKSS